MQLLVEHCLVNFDLEVRTITNLTQWDETDTTLMWAVCVWVGKVRSTIEVLLCS